MLAHKKATSARFQALARMTAEEKARWAIDVMTRDQIVWNEKAGREMTEDAARRLITAVAYRNQHRIK
jgi:hypothetical protein